MVLLGLYSMKEVRNPSACCIYPNCTTCCPMTFYNGADVVTMPPSVFMKMYDHVLTDKGLEIFDADIAAIEAKI